MAAKHITQLIGRTPVVELANISSDNNLSLPIWAKVESFNPGGSAKDRIALAMIDDAEQRGLLSSGSTIIEPTSGNTGVGLAMVCAVRGYRLILTMPDTMSVERRTLLSAYGAEIVLTPGNESMAGAVAKAEQLRSEIPGSIILQQFDNPSNANAHYLTTGVELWEQTEGTVDVFVACVGTGGTISGVGRRLKEFNPMVKIVAVEPSGSPVLSGGNAGMHAIQGIGAGFVPANYDSSVVDEILTVADADALHMMHELARRDGILAGVSSGAAVAAALVLAKRHDMQGKRIVVLLPDTGERYLSIMNRE